MHSRNTKTETLIMSHAESLSKSNVRNWCTYRSPFRPAQHRPVLEPVIKIRSSNSVITIVRWVAPQTETRVMAGATGAERFGARRESSALPGVAELVQQARMLSAKENAEDRRILKAKGAWSGGSVFSLESTFDTRRGTLLPDATLRVNSPTGRPRTGGPVPTAYPTARGANLAKKDGKETHLYIARLQDEKFFVGTFFSDRGDSDLSNLRARLDAHRLGDCVWTAKYPPLVGDDALYWFEEFSSKEKKGPDGNRTEAEAFRVLNAMVERLMFEKHKRHGLDAVRGGAYSATVMQTHQRRRLGDAFFMRGNDNAPCPVCGDGSHVSKRCAARREAVGRYAKWRRVCDGDVAAVSQSNSVVSDVGLETGSSALNSEGHDFAKQAPIVSLSNTGRSGAKNADSKASGSRCAEMKIQMKRGDPFQKNKKWTEAEEFDLLKALHAGFAGPREIARLARDRGRTEQDVLSRIKVLMKRVRASG
jgi:hypothetical protein